MDLAVAAATALRIGGGSVFVSFFLLVNSV